MKSGRRFPDGCFCRRDMRAMRVPARPAALWLPREGNRLGRTFNHLTIYPDLNLG